MTETPDLGGSQAEIVPENIKALSAVYFAAQFEALKFFAVADQVVDQFARGMLPISQAGALFEYYQSAPKRLTEAERQAIYTRAFGSREFDELWIELLIAVDTATGVGNAARALASYLSLRGYGVAHFAAIALRDEVKAAMEIFSHAEVLQAYGVRDIWQLIERVSTQYLGGAINSVRPRTLAQAGSAIISWLAERDPSANDAPTAELTANVKSVLAVMDLAPSEHIEIRRRVSNLLQKSDAYRSLPEEERKSISKSMVKITEALVGGQRELAEEVNFPNFVGELIRGVFQAVVEMSIEQMKAYGELVKASADSIDDFRADPTDSPVQVDPTAKLTQSRSQQLATTILMGINRLVVTEGRINEKLNFAK